RHLEPAVDERLPEVRVEEHVPKCPLADNAGNPPVVPDLLACWIPKSPTLAAGIVRVFSREERALSQSFFPPPTRAERARWGLAFVDDQRETPPGQAWGIGGGERRAEAGRRTQPFNLIHR